MSDFIGLLSRAPFYAAEQWLEAWTQGTALQRAALTAFVGAKDPCEARSRWFSELSRSSEAYLRSPPFLRMSREALGAMIASARLLKRFSVPVRAVARLRRQSM